MKIFHFAVPIFDYRIALISSELKDFRAWLARNRITDEPGDYDGLTIHPTNSSAILVFISSAMAASRKNSIVFHESLHAANYIFDDLNIKQDTDSDEGAAMLQTYIAEKILKRIGGK